MKKDGPIKPEYQAWRNRVEGQIRHMINEHPEYFNLPTKLAKERCIRSLGKRIIGEIVAGTRSGSNTNRYGRSSVSVCKKILCNFWSVVSRMVGGIPNCPPSRLTDN